MAQGLWWLGAMAPLISASNSLKGILDGAGQFGKSAFFKTLNSAAIFIVPYVLSFTNLNAISSVRFYWFVYFFQVLALSCEVFGNSSIFQLKLLEFAKHVKSNINDFIGYGIWANVSSLLSPLMTNFDRLLLSALFGPDIVAPYAMAQEATQRFLVIPLAVSTSYAPIFASNDKKYALSIYKSFKKRLDTFLALVFLILAFIVISYFQQWAGSEIHLDRAVLLLMCATGCINSYAQLPNVYLLSRGLSRMTAFLCFCEAVIYLPMAYFLITNFELMGAAVAALIRVLIDCISLRRLATI
jgi:O-antigen/teichoic acid export membrane protein